MAPQKFAPIHLDTDDVEAARALLQLQGTFKLFVAPTIDTTISKLNKRISQEIKNLSPKRTTPKKQMNGTTKSSTSNKLLIESLRLRNETMKKTIQELCSKVEHLKTEIKKHSFDSENMDSECSDGEEKYDPREPMNLSMTPKRCSKDSLQFEDSEYEDIEETEMVPIGDGHAKVPIDVLKNLSSNYTTATRELLTAVFSRKVLATHSLTGKQSPAFPGKPAKKILNPAYVNDIVYTVTERCNVPAALVRSSITTKCADESKMFRNNPNQRKRKRKPNYNKENYTQLKIPKTESFHGFKNL